MQSLSPEDASILALVAEHPDASVDELLDRTSSPRVKAIARALKSDSVQQSATPAVRKAVKGLKLWAKRNEVVHSSPKRKKSA